MRRRQFLGILGGTAAWPLKAYAQRAGQMRRIGVLMGTASNPETVSWFEAFRQELRNLGRIEGNNLRIDLRWGNGNIDRIRVVAAEMVDTKPDVIMCQSVRVLKTLKEKTHDIPVVFVATSDPVAQGMVTSFSHPGGNLTGFTMYEFSVTGKLVELLKEVEPGLKRIGVLYNRENTSAKGYLRTLEQVTPKFGLVLVPLPVRDAMTIEDAMSRFVREPNGGLLVPPDVTTRVYRNQIIALAEKFRVPAIFSSRSDTVAGGLMSYGPDLRGQFRGAATYADRILKGEKPADLPIQAPTQYTLLINLKTARRLGLFVPSSILAQTDELIE